MQYDYIRNRKKGKHLTLDERGKIEAYLKAGYTKKAIAEEIGVSERTIYREINRGSLELKNSDWSDRVEYLSDYAHKKYLDKQKAKEGSLKIGNNVQLANEIEKLIIERKYSPYAALKILSTSYDINFSLRTLYNYIHKHIFYELREHHLPYKKKYKKKYSKNKSIVKTGGRSIESRSKIINDRLELGHWEIDTVVGKRGTKACLLVLTERVSRREIIRKLDNKNMSSVVSAIASLKATYSNSFEKYFKTITSDNGVEFMDSKSIEEMGVTYFYAHSYCSGERGSNENNNKFIRRFINKGEDISKYSEEYIQQIEDYMNEYPRAMFKGKSANLVYNEWLV